MADHQRIEKPELPDRAIPDPGEVACGQRVVGFARHQHDDAALDQRPQHIGIGDSGDLAGKE